MRLINILIFLLFIKVVVGQTILAPSSINTLGGSGDVNGIHFDYSVGEPIVSFGGDGCDSLFAGFQACASDSLRIHKAALAIGGPTSVCAGNSVQLTAPVGASYLWNTGAVTQSINAKSTGNYHVRITNSCGDTIVSNTVAVTILAPPTPNICMVTVDSLGINNEIYWDKTIYQNVDSFIIYRYSVFSSSYLRIGAVSKKALSMFTDTARNIGGPNGGDPQISSYQYKIATRDTCGNLSALSPYHQTIFMQQNLQNFTWNAYTIENGSTFNDYIFTRDTLGDGNWHTYAGISGTKATDPTYLKYPKGRWRVYANGLSCTPTAKMEGANTQNTTRSNVRNNDVYNCGGPCGVVTVGSREDGVKIYPNPVTDDLTISLASFSSNCKIEVCNILGKTIGTTLVNDQITHLNVGEYPAGVYLVKVLNNNHTSIHKVLVQR